jgi:hypothetical protein
VTDVIDVFTSVWNCSLGHRLKYSLTALLAVELSLVNFSRINGSLGMALLKRDPIRQAIGCRRWGAEPSRANDFAIMIQEFLLEPE